MINYFQRFRSREEAKMLLLLLEVLWTADGGRDASTSRLTLYRNAKVSACPTVPYGIRDKNSSAVMED